MVNFCTVQSLNSRLAPAKPPVRPTKFRGTRPGQMWEKKAEHNPAIPGEWAVSLRHRANFPEIA